MQNIFLFDPTCFPYRIHVYTYFIKEFRKYGYELKIFYDNEKTTIDKEGFEPLTYAFLPFLRLHLKRKPAVSIFFIWLRYKFSLPFLIFTRLFLPTKSIVWSKGINIANINQSLKNTLYYIRQFAANALLLYSDFEKQFIKTNKRKVFIANNTINQYAYKLDDSNPEELQKKYNINYEKVVLFVGRIQERKRIDLLLDIFEKDVKGHALLIVGPGMLENYKQRVDQNENIYYLGPVYDLNKLSEIYALSSIFCIPGEVGLGINEAFLFGLPIVTSYIRPTSEIELLLQDNFNGLLFEKDNRDDLRNKLNLLLENDDRYNELSKNALESFRKKAKVEYMFEGFIQSLKYVLKDEK